MTPRTPDETLILDDLYGLLDPSESAAVAALCAADPAWAATRARLAGVQGLFAAAAKGSFPAVSFVPPSEAVPSTRVQKPAIVESEVPGPTVQSAWTRWVVAASLLLATAGLLGPATRDLIGLAVFQPAVNREVAGTRAAKSELELASTELNQATERAVARNQTAQTQYDQAIATWLKAEESAVLAATTKPFTLDVRGPASAMPGAPNEYTIAATSRTGQPVAVELTAKVVAGEKVLFETTLPAAATPRTIRLPAAIWTGLPAGSEPILTIAAVDPAAGTKIDVHESIRLLDAVYTTFLTTDKPLYRPGETVFFRSLTLDRTRFLPPEVDQTFRYELVGPSGQPVPGFTLSGLSSPSRLMKSDSVEPVLGPDGKPIRGIGSGAFALPSNLPGGEYVLTATYLPNLGVAKPPVALKPTAIRKFLVHSYTPDRFRKTLEFDGKTYGPGDTVQAKIQLFDQSKPLAGVELNYALDVDGVNVPLTVSPLKADAQGTATVRFRLPVGDEIRSARLTVVVLAPGGMESLIRQVPLASRRLSLEFFPEGGDLIVSVPNRVYFRAATTFGKPADVSGVLTDGTKTICNLATLSDAEQPGANQGLGVFTFTPEAGRTYSVRLTRPTDTIQPLADPVGPGLAGAAAAAAVPGFLLPKAKSTGVVLSVPNGVTKPGEPLRVRLISAGAKRSVVVGAYVRGQAIAHARTVLEANQPNEVSLDMGANKLGGVTRITVFEEPAAGDMGRVELIPIAERLVFRTPGQALKIGYSLTSENSAVGAAFIPRTTVSLTVSSTDETGKPAPAILWAAVVNDSVVAMADEKTARSLPTHFLLAGDVRHPDDLEHADFLLTDHPQAATALDLLLGTQGWRRFAEQAPDQFRQRVPAAEADRLLVAMGQKGPTPSGWKPELVRVYQANWPQYEAAVQELFAAESDRRSGKATAVANARVLEAESRYQGQLNQFGIALGNLEVFDVSMTTRTEWLPVTVAVTFVLGGFCFLRRLLRPRSAPDRRPLAIGAIGFVALGLLMIAVVLASRIPDQSWRPLALSAPKPDRGYSWQGFGGGTVISARPSSSFVIPDAPVDDLDVGNAPIATPRTYPGGQTGFIPENFDLAARAGMSPENALLRRAAAGPRLGQTRGIEGSPASRRLARDLQRLRLEADNSAIKSRPEYEAALRRILQDTPQTPPLVVRQYAHTIRQSQPGRDDGTRTDFTETLLWQPVLVVPSSGSASVSFTLSDALTGYRVQIAGHTLDGRLGAVEGKFEVRQPLSVLPRMPAEISSTDQLHVPVTVTNTTADPLTPSVTLGLDGLSAEADSFTVDVPARSAARSLIRLLPSKSEGVATLKLQANAGPGLTDATERTVAIVPDGFPVKGSHSEMLDAVLTYKVPLPTARIADSSRVYITIYPNVYCQLQGGVDGLMHEPTGCFEQSSTRNYPTVLIANLLKDSGNQNSAVGQKARELMGRGYPKLIGFECPKANGAKLGFEWFGAADAPHEALTAYGLMQFTDMAKVYPVEPELLTRTKQYLLDSRDGAGSFRRNASKIDTFGGAPTPITDAYIVWAISEAEKATSTPGSSQSDLTKELNALVARAGEAKDPSAKDPYYLALLGATLMNRDRPADAVRILQRVVDCQVADGSVLGAATSITGSADRDLTIETTALAVLAWQAADPIRFRSAIVAGMSWILTQRDASGTFGSTQATILALKAIVAQAATNPVQPIRGAAISIYAGFNSIAQIPIPNDAKEPIVVPIPNYEQFAIERLRIESTVATSYPVTIGWECRTKEPASSPACAVKLATKLSATEVREGDAVRLHITAENVTATARGMAVAIVGLPAGLKLPDDLKQLKSLTERPADGSEPVLSFWETRGRELVLYWRGLAPNQKISLPLDLVADVPGVYSGPASRAYLYYTADHKSWTAPVTVTIRPRDR